MMPRPCLPTVVGRVPTTWRDTPWNVLLKSCILRHLDDTGMIFKDKKYLEKLSKCWTHDLSQLMELAGLGVEFAIDCSSNPLLDANWGVAKDWTEVSRYEQKSSLEAQELFNAITGVPNGVLPWIQRHW